MADEVQYVAVTEPRLVQPPDLVKLEAHVQLATPTAEQIRAADGLFTEHKEEQLVTSLLGISSAAVLLHHMVADTFRVDEEEEELTTKDRKSTKKEEE
jgi:hypothetical protein